jgi:hypothetical protein
MAAARRSILVVAALGLGFSLSGCTSGNLELDPAYWFPDGKKKLPGDRREVFPGGVPGVTQGIPPEMIRGNPANQPEQAMAPVQEPQPQPEAAEKPRPRPKKVARPKPAPVDDQEQQAQPAPRATQAAPRPAQQQPQQPAGAWPAPQPQAQQQQPQPQAPAPGAWPAPPASGTFTR